MFLLLCWVVAYLVIANEYVLPSPLQTLRSVGECFADPSFYVAFGNTVGRVFLSFALSFLLGLLLAFFARLYPFFRSFLHYVISVIRTVPTMAIILILLLWTTPLVAPVIVTVMILLPMCYQIILSALDEVDKTYLDVAKTFCVSRKRQILQMYLPLAAPTVLSQTGGVFSMGLKVVISAEILSFTFQSLGGMMQEAKIYLEMPRLFALTVITVLFGFLAEALFAAVCKLATRWKDAI